MRPPPNERIADSIRNCSRMSEGVAPMALRMPISRVRSVTDTSMMFMMPMPPTSREMTATALRSEVIVPVIPWMRAISSVELPMLKSSLAGNGG